MCTWKKVEAMNLFGCLCQNAQPINTQCWTTLNIPSIKCVHCVWESTSRDSLHLLFHAALDWGGVSREFFELLCVECFDASKDGLFRRFKDSPQALVSWAKHARRHSKPWSDLRQHTNCLTNSSSPLLHPGTSQPQKSTTLETKTFWVCREAGGEVSLWECHG